MKMNFLKDIKLMLNDIIVQRMTFDMIFMILILITGSHIRHLTNMIIKLGYIKLLMV